MRIHSNNLTSPDYFAAARKAGVDIEVITEHGSRSRSIAHNVTLSGSGRTGGQWGNTGTHGAAAHKAATWDEWGMFIAALYAADDSVMTRDYANADAFHWVTADRYRSLTPDAQHIAHRWAFDGVSVSGVFTAHSCKCGAYTRRPVYGKTIADVLEVVGIDA